MPGATYVQSSFSGGQWSEFAQGKFHDRRYATALSVCLNGHPLETENWVRRPGTTLAALTRSGLSGRVLKFDFEEDTPAYTMVFTNGSLQFLSGTQQVTANDSTAVVAISSANPAVMQLASAVTWATGDQGFLSGLSANPLIENRLLSLTFIDTTHFSLTDAVTGSNIDGATLSAIGSNAVFNRILTVATPYIGGAWSSIRAVQSDASGTPVSFLLQDEIAPYAVVVESQPTQTQFATFQFGPASFQDGPYLDPPTNGAQLTANQKTGVVQLTLSFPAYVSTTSYSVGDIVTSSAVNYVSLIDQNVGNTPASSPSKWAETDGSAAINDGQGFLQTDIGRLIRLFSEPADWDTSTSYSIGNIVSYNPSGLPDEVTYWSSLTGSNSGHIPGTDTTNWQLLQQGGDNSPALWSWAKIVSLLNFIPGGVSGVTQIGDMTDNGGLAAAFNGTIVQNEAASAGQTAGGGVLSTLTLTGFVGQNYSATAATHYAIQSATIFPSTDAGIGSASVRTGHLITVQDTITCYLYASNTVPTAFDDGTLLGTTIADQTTSAPFGSNTDLFRGSSPVTIVSNDQTTLYKYVWVAIVLTFDCISGTVWDSIDATVSAAQVEFVAAGGSGASANGVTAELLGPALLYSTTIRTWRFGVYSNTTGWPQVGTWTDGRLWLSGSVPNRIDSSTSNGVTVNTSGAKVVFSPTDQYGNVLDSSGITVVMNLPESNPILWMMPDQQGIIVGTKAREALIFPPTPGGFTPTNIDARMTTRIGCADIEPQRTEHTTVFVQKFLREIEEYFADVFSGKFTAPNLIKDAKNLSVGGIQEIAYQQELAPIVWARVNNGLIGCTYIRDTLMTSSGPTVNGWHQHTLGSGRDIESICTGSSVNGNLDALTMVTNKVSNGTRFVEIISDILDEGSIQSAARYLDAAITPTSTVQVPVGTGFPYGGLQLNGLWPLNGETVTAWLGGLDCGDYTVSNGSISVPYGDGVPGGFGTFPTATNRYDQGLFTSTFVSTGITANGVTMWTGTMPMLVGFSFTSRGQLLRPITPADTGARNGPAFAKLARDHYITLQVEGAVGGDGGLKLGTDFSTLEPAVFKADDDSTSLNVDQQFSGVFRDQFECDYTFDARPAWEISRPQICNVQAIGAARETADI